MTNEVYMRKLADMQTNIPSYNSIKTEISGDLIQRQAVLETLDDMDNVLDEDRTIENYKELLKECYEVLPPVRPQEPCEDAISRRAVDEAIYDYSRSCDVNYAQIMEYIDKLPSVKPQEKTGHWLHIDDVMSVFDDYMCGEVDEEGIDTFLEMLRDKAEQYPQEPVLDKIRAEIEHRGDYFDENINRDIAEGFYRALKIIDKYRNEVSE